MTEALYLEDAYLREAPARVCQVTAEGGIVLDRTIFYPTGGGQPGDSGWLFWDGKRMPIATTVKGREGKSRSLTVGWISICPTHPATARILKPR